MDMYNERFCCANTQECQHMADITRNERQRHTWLEIGESWLKLAQANAVRPADLKKAKNKGARSFGKNERKNPPFRRFGT
jgi:hypothetical protein